MIPRPTNDELFQALKVVSEYCLTKECCAACPIREICGEVLGDKWSLFAFATFAMDSVKKEEK